MPAPVRRIRLALVAAALCVAALAGLPAVAAADRTAEVSIMDDQLLLGASREKIDHQMEIFKKLGVDRVRISAFWSQIAPQPLSTRKPAGFDATNPFFQGYNFTEVDRVVLSANAHGLKVMISISTPAPLWGTGSPGRGDPVWKPNPTEFGLFAGAVASRYGALVDHYGISNEPNQPQWLMPQYEGGKFVAPHVYRAMVQAAYPRIKAADPTSVALIGELAAQGSRVHSAGRPSSPLTFLRTMACRDSKYRRMRSGACARFTPVTGDAVGHHPYQFFFAPTTHQPNRNDAAIADGRRLLGVLDRLTRGGGLRTPTGHRFNVYYTEFGYQTNPPDPTGIPLRLQAPYLAQSAYLAYRTPRVKELNQFRLSDGRIAGSGPKKFAEFQSGLLFRNRHKKPAYSAFQHVFAIIGNRFFGQIRVARNSKVVVQRRRGRGWFEVAQVTANSHGYFSFPLAGRKSGRYRYKYSGGSGAKGTSAVVSVR